jgi:hypothetical protein
VTLLGQIVAFDLSGAVVTTKSLRYPGSMGWFSASSETRSLDKRSTTGWAWACMYRAGYVWEQNLENCNI